MNSPTSLSVNEVSEPTPGPWTIATSNSWRRIVSMGHGGMQSVCEPITQNDGHPDLYFRNGGPDGPDARLLAAAPDLLAAAKLGLSISKSWIDQEMTGTAHAGAMRALKPIRAAIARASGEKT